MRLYARSHRLLQYSCQVLSTLRNYARSNLYAVSGEWSNAITDCAKWLNGRGVGARWDGTWQKNQPTFGSCDGYSGDSSTWSDDYKEFLRKYVVFSESPSTSAHWALILLLQVLRIPTCDRRSRPGVDILDVEGKSLFPTSSY